MKNQFQDTPTLSIETGKGGTAGVPLAKRDRQRGMTQAQCGDACGGTGGLVPGDAAAVAAAAKAGRK